MLHMHMLLWIGGNLNPEEMRAKILSESSEWCKSLLSWLGKCHSGDFLSGTHAEVSTCCEQLRANESYIDPTQTLPVPPRECHGLPWGFPGKPTPVPVETRIRVHRCRFSQVRVMGLIKPTGSQSCRTGFYGFGLGYMGIVPMDMDIILI